MRQNPHVRICGGPGSATTLVYPTPAGRDPLPPADVTPIRRPARAPNLKRLHGALRAHHQGLLPRAHGPDRRGLAASRRPRVRRALPPRTESPGARQSPEPAAVDGPATPWSRPVPPAARGDVARRLSVSSVIHDRPSTPRSGFWTVRGSTERQQGLDGGLQPRQFLFDRCLHQPEIHAEVVVRQTIAHACDLLPRNLRGAAPCAVRKLLDRFADDLEFSNDCVLPHPVADERCACEAPLSGQDLGHPWFCSSRRRIFKALLLGSSSRNAKERGTL